MHYRKLTKKGNAIVKLLNDEYLRAFKEGFSHEQAEEIALARVVQSER